MTPNEIREVRASYGLTQQEFEVALGVGAKTVVRWENGTVAQSRAANSLLRLAREMPEAFAAIAEWNGYNGSLLEVGTLIQGVSSVNSRFVLSKFISQFASGEIKATTISSHHVYSFGRQPRPMQVSETRVPYVYYPLPTQALTPSAPVPTRSEATTRGVPDVAELPASDNPAVAA